MCRRRRRILILDMSIVLIPEDSAHAPIALGMLSVAGNRYPTRGLSLKSSEKYRVEDVTSLGSTGSYPVLRKTGRNAKKVVWRGYMPLEGDSSDRSRIENDLTERLRGFTSSGSRVFMRVGDVSYGAFSLVDHEFQWVDFGGPKPWELHWTFTFMEDGIIG